MKTVSRFFPELLLVLSLTIFSNTLLAETIHVPSEQPTIQAGIDAAKHGDIVLVTDGIYTGEGNRNIAFKGKAITVRSVNGYQHCIIDCEGSEGDFRRGFIFCSDEKRNSILEGFTIKNAYLNETDCMFEDGNGAGILVCSSPTIRNNRICNNRASFGAGIYSSDSALIENNIIADNVSTRWGGGILPEGNEMIVSNIITGNTATDMGGGIWYRHGDSPQLINNIIVGNHTNGQGGGIAFSAAGSMVIIGNLISNNSADGFGGGMYIDISEWEEAVLPIYNNSFVNNTATNGGGVFNVSATDTFTNCLFWGNTPNDAVNCNLTYCCIEELIAGEGNIHDNPLLITKDQDITSVDNSSPCINAGKPDFSNPCLPEMDYFGNSRITNGRIDIGAFELGDKLSTIMYPVKQSVFIYPNPAGITLTINSDGLGGELKSYQLIDNQGRVVLSNECSNDEVINISTLPAGSYFLKLQFEGEAICEPVIIY